MIEGAPKKSKALIISLIIVIILGIFVFFIFKNKEKVNPTNDSSSSGKIFQSLFGTSKSKNVQVVETLSSGKNAVTVNAEAGEDIKKGDLLYKVGYNKNGDIIVKKIKNKNYKLSDIYGIALEDIAEGNIGSILLPDISSNLSLWEKFINEVGGVTTNIKDWITQVINPNPVNNPNLPQKTEPDIYSCTFDGSIMDCSEMLKMTCTNTDGSIIECAQIHEFKCSKNGQEIDCGSLLTFPIININATPITLSPGESSTISWVSNNTTSCKRDDLPEGQNVVDLSGSFNTGILNNSALYSITCTGINGTTSGSVYIFVNTGAGDGGYDYPSVTVSANPVSIKSGESSTITWNSTNATSCKRNDLPEGENEIELSGEFDTGALTSSTSYSITCEGDEGVGSGYTFVLVMNDDYSFNQCGDGIDNDKIVETKEDGTVVVTFEDGADMADPGCFTNFDTTDITEYHPEYLESREPFFQQCGDGIDNDKIVETKEDGTVVVTFEDGADMADPQCYNSDGVYDPNIFFESGSIIITPPDNPNDDGGKKYQCSDRIDNDFDGFIDELDPSCHTDFDINNTSSYSEYLDDESLTDSNDNTTNSCSILDDYPLKFTTEEQNRLEGLLRKFYLLAPNLKSEDDINIALSEAQSNKELVANVEQLTNECYAQSIDKNGNIGRHMENNSWVYYTGPKVRYGNPWYKQTERGTYLPENLYIGNNYSDPALNIFKKEDLNGFPITYSFAFHKYIYKIVETLSKKYEAEMDIDSSTSQIISNEINKRGATKKGSFWDFELLLNIW